jgi:hypothetical protein
MARFPRIQNPCPYKGALAEIMDGDQCRLCKREVHDLSAMDEGQRQSFLSACEGEVCVSYGLRPAIAAAALGAALLIAPVNAAAQETPDLSVTDPDMFILVGGITDLANIEYIEDSADVAMSDLPVVYDNDDQQADSPSEQAADPQSPVSQSPVSQAPASQSSVTAGS